MGIMFFARTYIYLRSASTCLCVYVCVHGVRVCVCVHGVRVCVYLMSPRSVVASSSHLALLRSLFSTVTLRSSPFAPTPPNPLLSVELASDVKKAVLVSGSGLTKRRSIVTYDGISKCTYNTIFDI